MAIFLRVGLRYLALGIFALVLWRPASPAADGARRGLPSREPPTTGGAGSAPPADRRLTRRAPALARLRTGIRHLFPGYFALVMATGIVSVAVGSDGSTGLSAAMLVVAIVGYLVLIACYLWRFASYRPEFMADAAAPWTAFSLFTFTAGSDVLGTRLAGSGYYTATAALLVVSGTGWLLLTYGVPLSLITSHGARSALAGINGSWFLWTVGTQSLAVALASLKPPLARPLAVLAVLLWAVGVLLYLITATLVLAGLLHFPVQPAGLTPAYWVFMGATAISVLAGRFPRRRPSWSPPPPTKRCAPPPASWLARLSVSRSCSCLTSAGSPAR